MLAYLVDRMLVPEIDTSRSRDEAGTAHGDPDTRSTTCCRLSCCWVWMSAGNPVTTASSDLVVFAGSVLAFLQCWALRVNVPGFGR